VRNPYRLYKTALRNLFLLIPLLYLSVNFCFLNIKFNLVNNVYSDEYFYQYKIKQTTPLLYKNISSKVEFAEKPMSQLLIRPKVTGGLVEFYDFKEQRWDKFSNNWNLNIKNIPFVLLRVHDLEFKKIILSFELLNINNGNKYITNKLYFWSAYEYKEYIKKVNVNILSRISE